MRAANVPGPAAAEPPRYLSPEEAADYLRMSLSWLRKATRAGKVTHVTLGWRIVYDRRDLDYYVENCKKAAALEVWDRRPRRRARRAVVASPVTPGAAAAMAAAAVATSDAAPGSTAKPGAAGAATGTSAP